MVSYRPDLVHLYLTTILVRVPIRAYSASASAVATLLMHCGLLFNHEHSPPNHKRSVYSECYQQYLHDCLQKLLIKISTVVA